MELKYDHRADAAAVRTRGEIPPGGVADTERLDADRLVHYDEAGAILKYEFLNVRRFGVRLDDLQHRDELAALFSREGFVERDWGHPIPTKRRRPRRGTVAG